MDTAIRKPAAHVWLWRLGALVVVVLLGQVVLPGAFTWAWPRVYPLLGLSDEVLQQHDWIQLYATHAWMLVAALALIVLAGGSQWRHWSGLNFDQLRLSLRIVGWFSLAMLGFFAVLHVSLVLLGQPWPLELALTPLDIAGFLLFQLLVSGLTEEIWFRGLIQSFLGVYWTGTWRVGRLNVPAVVVLSALFFGLAHVNFTLWPLHLDSFNPVNAVAQVGFGAFYAWARYRTGSVLAPILTHGIANFISGGLIVLLALLR